MAEFMDDPGRACAPGKIHPEDFFSDRGPAVRRARQACAGCPFQIACTAHAVSAGEKWGIWGGVLFSSVPERREASRRHHVRIIDEQVRKLHEREFPDGRIALILGVSKAAVRQSRIRQDLPALYGSRGVRLAVAA